MSNEPEESSRTSKRWNRPDASMSLLADLMTSDALDPGYVAADRPATRTRPSRSTGFVLVFAVVVFAGLLLATAATEVRQEGPGAERQRDRIIGEIETRTAQTDRLQAKVRALRAEMARARAERLALSAAGRRAQRNLRALSVAAGATPVQGPGVRVTVDDAVGGDNADSPDAVAETRVLDRDLQQLVNALWAAGADAIAVDGQRLTAATAIRAAGDAILVDYRPVKPPYVITAVGDPETMEVRFVDSKAGRLFRTLESTFGIGFDVERSGHLELPEASTLTLHYAREVRHK